MKPRHAPRSMKRRLARLALPLLAVCSFAAHAAQPLKIGYSDWPGWVAWQVAIEKDWFKEVGVDVAFEWFDYSASMQAFAAGQVDAVTMTNGDALVTGAGGGKSVMLLLNGLKKAGMQEADVTLVNAKTNEMPQMLDAGADVDAGRSHREHRCPPAW